MGGGGARLSEFFTLNPKKTSFFLGGGRGGRRGGGVGRVSVIFKKTPNLKKKKFLRRGEGGERGLK